jgi:chemotaxis protein methyltransferase CheR
MVLTQDKAYMLDSRLSPVARKWGFESLSAMTQSLRGVPNKNMISDIIEAMSTHDTSFFRDIGPFYVLRDTLLPYLIKNTARDTKKLRVWCSACSSGQEPYSVAMILHEQVAQMPGWSFEILATDISHEILELAKDGIYTQTEVQRGVPVQYLLKYFTHKGDKWQVNADIRSMIKFQNLNLLEPLPDINPIDLVVCRNILLHFDEQTQTSVMKSIAALMNPEGFFMLGGSDTNAPTAPIFREVDPKWKIYALPGSSFA